MRTLFEPHRHGAAGGGALGALIAALLVAGCASTGGLTPAAKLGSPDDLQAAQTFADVRVTEGDWPETDWWREFADTQLDRLQAEALAGSPTLKLAQARVAKAQALVGAARSALLPHVEGNAASTLQRFTENGVIPPPFAGTWQTDSRATLNFGYELDFWGKNRAALAAALGEAEAARIDALSARLVISAGVAGAYVELGRLYDQLDLAQATLADRQRIYDLTRERVVAGLATRVELKQAEAALPATREDIVALNELIALTRDQLAALMGAGPDRGLAIARPQLRVAPGAVLPARLPAALVGRRPDVLAQRWRVEATSKDIEVAKARFYPDVNLIAFAGLQSIGLGQFFRAGSLIGGVGPALTLPVFEGGRLRSGLAAANADYDAAVEQYNRTLVDALHDIADQLASIRSVAAQTNEQQAAIGTAREAYDLALLRYREGVGDYLTVLSAEGQLLAQQRLAVDLRARSLELAIGLARSLGGGLARSESAAAPGTHS